MAGGRPADSLAVRRRVEAGDWPRVWLWSGPETFLKEELFARMAAGMGDEGGFGDLNVSRFRGNDDEVDRIINTCRTLPMLGERRLVYFAAIEGLSRGAREVLATYVESPSPETVLVLAGTRNPNDSLHKRLTAAGADAAVFWTPFREQTLKWITIRFREAGKRCHEDVAAALFRRCGGDLEEKVSLAAVSPEIEKVALGMGEREVVEETDLDVVGRQADESLLYEIGSRVAHRDLPGALRAADGALLFRENNEIRVVATVAHRIFEIAKVRDLVDSGLSPDEALRAAGIWRMAADDVRAGVRRFDRESIERAIAALTAADRTLKSSPRKSRAVLEEALSAVCGV